MSTPAEREARLVAELGPVGGDEASVNQLILWVHKTTCGPFGKGHDPLCNTMRLLAEDQQHLAEQAREHRTPPTPERHGHR